MKMLYVTKYPDTKQDLLVLEFSTEWLAQMKKLAGLLDHNWLLISHIKTYWKGLPLREDIQKAYRYHISPDLEDTCQPGWGVYYEGIWLTWDEWAAWDQSVWADRRVLVSLTCVLHPSDCALGVQVPAIDAGCEYMGWCQDQRVPLDFPKGKEPSEG